MAITVDNLQDWQNGHQPNLMENFVEFLTEYPDLAVQVNYADETPHSYLRKVNN